MRPRAKTLRRPVAAASGRLSIRQECDCRLQRAEPLWPDVVRQGLGQRPDANLARDQAGLRGIIALPIGAQPRRSRGLRNDGDPGQAGEAWLVDGSSCHTALALA
jgi:hypothetical protein